MTVASYTTSWDTTQGAEKRDDERRVFTFALDLCRPPALGMGTPGCYSLHPFSRITPATERSGGPVIESVVRKGGGIGASAAKCADRAER